MTATAARVLDEARQYIGYHEGRTKGGDWDNITKFGERYGLNGVPWCQIFQWCIFQDAGAGALIPKTASCEEAYTWYRNRGLTGRQPRVGALVYFGTGATHHVGIVESFTAATMTYISGNTGDGHVPSGTGNAVERKALSRSNPWIHGYAYPQYAAPAPAPKPKPGPGRRVVTVLKGQTLSRIAALAGISLSALLALNPGLRSHPNTIHPGDKVTVPATAPASPHPTVTVTAKPKPSTKPSGKCR